MPHVADNLPAEVEVDASDRADRVVNLQLRRQQLVTELNSCLVEIEEHAPEFDDSDFFRQQPVSEILSTVSEPNCVTLHLHVMNPFSICSIIHEGTTRPVGLKDAGRQASQELQSRWRSAYLDFQDRRTRDEDAWDQTIEDITEELSQLVIRPALTEFDGDATHIRLIPHRELNIFPLHLCRTPSGQRLCEQYTVSYAPGLTMLSHRRRAAETEVRESVAVADVLSSGLPCRRLEIDAFCDSFGKAVTKFSPSTTFPLQDVQTNCRDAAMLHWTGHGEFVEANPLDSRLPIESENGAGSTGAITVRDVLSGLKLSKTSVVTLSACESGVMVPEGMDDHVNFSVAFLMAGAGCVVTSLWPVPDRVSYLLMSRVSEGQTVVHALHNAQRWMRGLPDDGGEFLASQRQLAEILEEAGLADEMPTEREKKKLQRQLELWRKDKSSGTTYSTSVWWNAFTVIGDGSFRYDPAD